jgi:multidrug transporter EmrE-like cation transporter
VNAASLSLVLCSLGLAGALVGSHVLMRHAAQFAPLSRPWIISNASALAIYVVIFVLYTLLLRRFALSQLYPTYTALSVMGVYAAGVLLFNEPMSPLQVLGLVLVAVGIFLLAG